MPIVLRTIVQSIAVLGLLLTVHVEARGNSHTDSRTSSAPTIGGFQALSGMEAELFILPGDVELVSSQQLAPYGLTVERYQQFFGLAQVLGGQLTLQRTEEGRVKVVTGAHYPDIRPTNNVQLSAAVASGLVDRKIGPDGQRITRLMIDPESGRYFYWVETRRFTSRWVLWIGAQDGRVLNRYDALANQGVTCGTVLAPCGFGVEYDNGIWDDIKDLSGLIGPHPNYSGNILWAGGDFRVGTYDYGSVSYAPFIPFSSDEDDAWVELGNASPAQQALVDAHYYAFVTVKYLQDVHGYNWADAANSDPDMPYDYVPVVGHYGANYNNAFWNGAYVAFGDGDGIKYRELTALDVVAHELTHGVTDFTSNLIYQGESGALNEAFSDIMAASVEFFADAQNLEPGQSATAPIGSSLDAYYFQPDWLVGEEFDLRGDTMPGLRNMADPEEDGDPDHYSERYTGTADNGGVHSNSGIANHAFYLLAQGGQNASCLEPNDHNALHCGPAEPSVIAVGLTDAERIFFLGFYGLTENATMCDARNATVAQAEANYGGAGNSVAISTRIAWEAVGLTADLCENGPPQAHITYDPTAPVTNELINLQSNASDPDDDDLAFSWSLISKPRGSKATLSSATETASFVSDKSGDYRVRLSVSDGIASTLDEVNISVTKPGSGGGKDGGSGGKNCAPGDTRPKCNR